MERIREIDALRAPLQSVGDGRIILAADVRQSNQRRQRVKDALGRKSVKPPQDPFALEQDGLGQEDRLAIEERPRPSRLSRIIAGQETNDDVSIDRDHVAP